MKYNINDLVEMLSYRRAARSEGEEKFISKYIDSVAGMKSDSYGNRYIAVGSGDTIFSCHTDTVHHNTQIKNTPDIEYIYDTFGEPTEKYLESASNTKSNVRQKVNVKGKWAFKTDGDVLGADDGTGCWLCLNMLHKTPGLYIFHRDEETGGRGSKFFAENNRKIIEGYKKIISFDRKDYTDVITHQQGKRCCSDEFAMALSKEIGGMFPTDKGVFTDSANYTYVIPECTNISIGYFSGHTQDESQDLVFADSLLKRLISVNWTSLPVVKKIEKTVSWSGDWNNYGYEGLWGRPWNNFSDSYSLDGFSNSRQYHYNAPESRKKLETKVTKRSSKKFYTDEQGEPQPFRHKDSLDTYSFTCEKKEKPDFSNVWIGAQIGNQKKQLKLVSQNGKRFWQDASGELYPYNKFVQIEKRKKSPKERQIDSFINRKAQMIRWFDAECNSCGSQWTFSNMSKQYSKTSRSMGKRDCPFCHSKGSVKIKQLPVETHNKWKWGLSGGY
jgi:hypothetical protein